MDNKKIEPGIFPSSPQEIHTMQHNVMINRQLAWKDHGQDVYLDDFPGEQYCQKEQIDSLKYTIYHVTNNKALLLALAEQKAKPVYNDDWIIMDDLSVRLDESPIMNALPAQQDLEYPQYPITSIKVTPSVNLSTLYDDHSRVLLFELPTYATTDSKQYDIYFRPSATTDCPAEIPDKITVSLPSAAPVFTVTFVTV